MADKNNSSISGSKIPQITFVVMIICFASFIFLAFLPIFQDFFISSLNATVHNDSHELVKQLTSKKETAQSPKYLLLWYIDVNMDSDNAIRYIFNPLLSISLPSLIGGIILAVFFSALLPFNLGYMRTKIKREIEVQLSKISNYRNDEESESELANKLINLNLESLKKSTDEWGVNIEDLSVIQKAIKWQNMNLFQRIFSINDGLTMYMRFHFTYKYSNIVLGFVYIGAAILIIIVGLRGLKFIPNTQPSLVLFSLSLEFSLLVTYAFTIMYGKQEEEQEKITPPDVTLSMTGVDLGSSKDIENFLRVFIKNNDNQGNK